MRYSYKAKSFQGDSVSGDREAKDRKELAEILRKEGFILTEAEIKKKVLVLLILISIFLF